MKNKTLLSTVIGILAVTFCITITSCGTIQQYSWDSMLEPEAAATIVTNNMHEITAYNGNDVTWTKKKGTSSSSVITIPAGDTELLFTAEHTERAGQSTTHYIVRNIPFQFNFEAGKKYFIEFNRNMDNSNVWGIYLYSSHWARKDQIIDFIPIDIVWR
jgi:hypothetical protein